MRKLTKKALSAAMAVLLVFTSTFAGSKGTARAEEPERAEIAVDTADALADALTNAENAANIVLSTNITVERNEGFVIAADRDITLDLNGHELKLIAPEKSNTYLFDVYGTLTVNDSTGTGRLFLSSKESDSGTSNAYAVLINHGSLTMNSGTIECAPLGSPNRTYGISNQINGSLTMNGGSIKTPFFGTGISVSVDSETGICSTTLHGGSISGGATGIWLESNGYKNTYATLLIDGGTFNGSNNALMVSGNNPKYFRVTICDRVNTDDGSVISTPVFMNNVMFGNTTNPDNIIVSGGDFYGLSGCYSLVKGSKFISGGNYYNDTSQNSSNYLLPNKYVYTNVNGYSVRDESFFPVYVDVTYSLNNEKQNKRYVFDAIAKAFDFCRNIDKSEGHDITDYQIILNKDCVTDEQLIVPAGKAYTLNLNGKVLSSTGAGYQSVLLVENGGALVINDTTGGRITTGSAAQYAAVILTSKDNYDETATATLTVNGGTLVGRYYAIVGNGNRHNTNITINGGTLTATEANDNTAIYHPQNGTLTVNGGTITGATGIYMKSGKLSITGGTITGNGTAVDYKPTGDGAQITGDALVIDNCGYPGGAPVPSVTGGTFVSTNAAPIGSYTSASVGTVIGGFVGAGSFNKEIPRALCLTGMGCYQNGGNTYGIMPIRYVAEVDGERYEAFSDAVTNASGKTIKLLNDVAGYTMSSLSEVLTVDKNGHNISIFCGFTGYKLNELLVDDLSVFSLVQDPSSDHWTVKLSKDGKDIYYANVTEAFAAAKEYTSCALTLLKDCTTTTQLVVPNGLTLTLNLNGKELVSTGAGYQSVLLVENGGSLTINDTDGGRIVSGNENQYAAVILTAKATYNESLSASLTVNGGTLVGYYYAIVGNGNRHNTDITINGGSITALAENDNVGIYHPQNGTLTINGGTITGATGIYMKSGTLTINGGTITGNGTAAEYVTTKDGLWVTGDALVIDNCGYPGGAPVPTVTGGTFISTNAAPIASYTSASVDTVIGGFVNAGTFNKEIARFLCEKDLTSTPDGNGMYIIAPIPYVAIVNGVYYEFFEDAAAASKKTAVITLLADIDAYALTSSSAKLLIKKNGFHINITCTAANYMLNEVTDEDGITTFSCVQDPSSDYWCVYIAFADGSVKYYNSITTASSGVKNGCTLYLMKDVVTTNRTTFGNFSTKNGDITIDLNGHTLTFDHSAGKSSYAPIYITYNNHVTIRNGNIIVINDEAISVKEGSVTLAEDLTISSDKAAVVVWGTSSVTTSATITVGDDFAIAANGSAGQAADITILGGSIKSDSIAIYQPSAGSLTIEGGTITGSTPVYVKSGKLTVTGGVLHATGEKKPYQYYGNGAYTTGDALVIDNCGYPGGTPVPSVTGGTFISDNASPIASYANEATDKVLGGFVSGGTFNKEIERFLCTKDLTSTPDGNGMYIIAPIPYVASINGVRYEFLSDAVAAVPADGTETTIVLLRDAVGNGITTNAGQNIVIDFNGFTYNVDKTVGSAGTETNGFQLLKDSKVTLKNGTLTSNTAKILIQNYSELTVLDMNLDGTKSSACNYVVSNNNGSLDVLGDTSITASPGKVAFDVCVTSNYPDGVVVTIDTTGTVTGAIEYDLWGTKPAVNKTGLIIKNGT
ncbi:MAG: hypothetical protein MJ064_09255, partial [Lachnospiraceae bacterium]|nr:hypothetical protein [Lachnospiraceae bacterium]